MIVFNVVCFPSSSPAVRDKDLLPSPSLEHQNPPRPRTKPPSGKPAPRKEPRSTANSSTNTVAPPAALQQTAVPVPAVSINQVSDHGVAGDEEVPHKPVEIFSLTGNVVQGWQWHVTRSRRRCCHMIDDWFYPDWEKRQNEKNRFSFISLTYGLTPGGFMKIRRGEKMRKKKS